jgi:hypothetical protein
MDRFINVLIGFGVGWIVSLVEYAFCSTAFGGTFTLLMIPVVAAALSILYVAAAWLVGLLLRLPKVRDVWALAGWKVVLFAIAPLCVLIFSSSLGLRSIEPESGYSMMSWRIGFPCYFLIVFPFVNLPVKRSRCLSN